MASPGLDIQQNRERTSLCARNLCAAPGKPQPRFNSAAAAWVVDEDNDGLVSPNSPNSTNRSQIHARHERWKSPIEVLPKATFGIRAFLESRPRGQVPTQSCLTENQPI